MELDAERLKRLVCSLLTEEHCVECDDCYAQIDRFVELELAGKDPGEVLPRVAKHLRECRACAEEYQALLDALRSLD